MSELLILRCVDALVRAEDRLRLPPPAALYLAGVLEAAGADVRVVDLDIVAAGMSGGEQLVDQSERAPLLPEPLTSYDQEEYRRASIETPALLSLSRADVAIAATRDGQVPELEPLIRRLLASVTPTRPILVAHSFQAYFSPLVSLAIAACLAHRLRETTGAPQVIGGRGLSALPAEVVSSLPGAFDAVAFGQGHRSLVELWHHFEIGEPGLGQIPGLLFRLGGELTATPQVPIRTPHDHEPFLTPAFHSVDLDAYRYDLGIHFGPAAAAAAPAPLVSSPLPFWFTRGCRNDCSFCVHGSLPLACLPPEVAAERLVDACSTTGHHTAVLLNTQINPGRAFVRRFCEELLRLESTVLWIDSAEFHDLDAPTLELMARAGCVGLWFGLESPDDAMLARIGKRTTVREATRVLRASHDVGIWNGVNFIVGLPHEPTDAGARVNRFIDGNRERIDMWAINPFHLRGGSYQRDPPAHGIHVRERRKGTAFYAFDEVDGHSWEAKTHATEAALADALRGLDRERNLLASSGHLLLGMARVDRDKNSLRSTVEGLAHPGTAHPLLSTSRRSKELA